MSGPSKQRGDRVQIATFVPIGTLTERGLGKAQDSEQAAIEQEIRLLRDRYFYLESRYRGLLAAFQMLRPLLKNPTLRKRLEKDGKEQAAALLSSVLFEACVLDCHTMLHDGDEAHPSLCTLTRPFRKSAREPNHAKVVERLASIYSERKPYWPDASKVGVFSAEEQAAWRAKTERANAGRRGAFFRIVNRLRLDWDQLNKNGELIRPYRHNVVAHLMLELDKATQRYQLGKIPDAEKLYTTIEDLLPIIRRSVVSLGFLFGVGADRIGLYEKMAKKNAAVFWDLEAATSR
jgi:hypothetical protein